MLRWRGCKREGVVDGVYHVEMLGVRSLARGISMLAGSEEGRERCEEGKGWKGRRWRGAESEEKKLEWNGEGSGKR